MTSRVKTRGHVSVSAQTLARLKAAADRAGVSPRERLEAILAKLEPVKERGE